MSDVVDISDLDLADKVINIEQITWGGYSDIAQGTLLTDSSKVALKTLRMHGANGPGVKERLQKRLYREVLLWMKLEHSNVVPLLGYMQPLNEAPSLVSPWYINGNIIDYLNSCPNPDRYVLALDVVRGLGYLHSIPVAHGDLKGENVLVDANGHASLCDFGMSQFIDDANRIAGYTTSNAHSGGTVRFMSPELLEDGPKTIASDMWAAGCLIVQIITDEIPYQGIGAKHAVYPAILRGDPPWMNRNSAISEALWDCIQSCWSIAPANRPQASKVATYFATQEGCLTPIPSIKDLTLSSHLKVERFSDVPKIKVSPDGLRLALASSDGIVRIWDAQMGVLKPLKPLVPQKSAAIVTRPNEIFHVAWSASRRYFLVRSNEFFKVYMVRTNELVLEKGYVSWADFLPEVSAVAMLMWGDIFVMDLCQGGATPFRIQLGFDCFFSGEIAFSPDRKRLMVVTASALTVYSVKTSKAEARVSLPQTYPEPRRSISICNSGHLALVSSRTRDIELWEMNVSEPDGAKNTLSLLNRYTSADAASPGFQEVQFGGPTDELVLGVSPGKPVHVWDREGAMLIHLFGYSVSQIIRDISLRWGSTNPRDFMLAAVTSSENPEKQDIQIWSILPST